MDEGTDRAYTPKKIIRNRAQRKKKKKEEEQIRGVVSTEQTASSIG